MDYTELTIRTGSGKVLKCLVATFKMLNRYPTKEELSLSTGLDYSLIGVCLEYLNLKNRVTYNGDYAKLAISGTKLTGVAVGMLVDWSDEKLAEEKIPGRVANTLLEIRQKIIDIVNENN